MLPTADAVPNPTLTSRTRLDALKRRATYARWRRSIPYTDDQILATLCEMQGVMRGLGHANPMQGKYAEDVVTWFTRTRHLTGPLYRFVLPYLVKTCAICGRTAHYRYGSEGRCQAHKQFTTAGFAGRTRALDRRARGHAHHLNEKDQDLRRRDVSRTRARNAKRPSKA